MCTNSSNKARLANNRVFGAMVKSDLSKFARKNNVSVGQIKMVDFFTEFLEVQSTTKGENFLKRNRIIAGMAELQLSVESAAHTRAGVAW